MIKRKGRTSRNRVLKRRSTVFHSLEKDPFKYNDIKFLMKWMKECGFRKVCKLSPYEFMETGRGLMCRENQLHSGQLIVRIPLSLLITIDTVCRTDLPFDPLTCDLNSIQVLASFLMWEKKKGRASKWYHYIYSLPQCSFDNLPYLWPQNHIKRIKPYSLLCLVLNEAENFENSMIKVLKVLKFPFDVENYNLFKWCWAQVNTRCIHLDVKSGPSDHKCALAPFLDLLNHSFDAKIETGFNATTNCFEIKTLSPYKKYQQVFINYGIHSNRSLFLHYGFILKDNPNDAIPVSSSLINKLVSDFCLEKTYKLLMKLNIINAEDNFIISRDGFEWKLEMILKILSINKFQDVNEMKNIYFGDIELNPEESLTYHSLKDNLLERILKEYDGQQISQNTQMLTLLIFEELKIIKHHLKSVHQL